MLKDSKAALIGALLLVAGVACETTAQRARAVEEGLLKLDAQDVRHCLGDPANLQWNDEVEVMVYRWIPARTVDEQLEAEQEALRPEMPDALEDRHMSDREKRRERWEYEPFCELKFAIVDKQVIDVEADGRDKRGLRLDDHCMSRARRCVPELRTGF